MKNYNRISSKPEYLEVLFAKLEIIILQARILDFQNAGVQTMEKGQTNIKRKKKRKKAEYKVYTGDNFLIIRSYKIRYTYDC